MAHQLHNLAVKIADLLLDGSARLEQRSDRSYQLRTAVNGSGRDGAPVST